MPTALLLISFQRNYFRKKGSPKVKGAKKSAKAAVKLLQYFRENHLPVVHVLQTGKLEDFSGEGLQPYESLEPKDEESTVIMSDANAFADQRLIPILKSHGIDQLLIVGLTAENQIVSSAKAAIELGYACSVAQDACAATTLKMDGEKIQAELVHKVAMAMMHTCGVEICTAKEFIKAEQKKSKKRSKEEARQMAIEEAAKAALQAASEQDPNTNTLKKTRKKGKRTTPTENSSTNQTIRGTRTRKKAAENMAVTSIEEKEA